MSADHKFGLDTACPFCWYYAEVFCTMFGIVWKE